MSINDKVERFVIIDVHPKDFFYEFRYDFIGKTIDVDFYRPSRRRKNFYYCHGRFEKPIVSENIIIQEIVFQAVKLGVQK